MSREVTKRRSLRQSWSILVVLGAAASGASCVHLLEPIRPPAIPNDELRPLAPGGSVRIENGYTAPETRTLRDEGVHDLVVDLRDWTARLVSELRFELERMGMEVEVPAESLKDTSSEPSQLRPRTIAVAASRSLRVRFTRVEFPPPGTNATQTAAPLLEAEVSGSPDGFQASYRSSGDASTLSEALLDLKRKILEDDAMRAWLVPGQPASNRGLVFRPLWNGVDLTGWRKVLDSEWKVENGILSSRQDPAGRREGESWLITESQFTDFALRVEFRITPGGNSGVFLRDPVPLADRLAAPDGGKPPWDAGFEAQINAEDPNYSTGSIWELGKAPAGLHKIGDWNELLIRVEGDRVQTWVNGHAAVDIRQTRSKQGAIGLQRHGTAQYRDKVIEFRKIEIAEIR